MNKTKLYLLLAMVMMMWGLNVVAIKLLIVASSPITITGVRIALGGLIVLLYLRVTTGLSFMSPREVKGVFAMGILGFAGQHLLLAMGLLQTTASHTTLILALNPLATALLAGIILKNRISNWRMLGIALGLTGVLAIFVGEEGSLSITIGAGDWLVFAAMLVQAMSFVLIKPLIQESNVAQITGVSLTIGGVTLAGLGYFIEGINLVDMLAGLTGELWAVLLASAFLATGLGGVVWNWGISQIGAGQTAIFINMTPFFGLLGAAVFLDEVLKFSYLVGFAFIAVGVFFGSGAWEEQRAKMNA